ncbi:MAG: type II toxin-antitoxin system RelE/ParE family toxin [Bacteroidota bacterium]
MVKYKVTVDKSARDNLKSIFNYIKEESSTTAANKVRKGLMDVIYGLAEMPSRHKIFPKISNKKYTYRRALKWSYKIVFVIDEEELVVRVVDIIHASQNLSTIKSKFQ